MLLEMEKYFWNCYWYGMEWNSITWSKSMFICFLYFNKIDIKTDELTLIKEGDLPFIEKNVEAENKPVLLT